MSVLEIVKQPCHEDLDDEESQDGGNVVLHGQNVMSVLEVQKGPSGTAEGIYQSQGAVEGQLGNLSSREFAVGVSELDNARVVADGISKGADAVVASARNRIVDGRGFS